MAVAVEALPAAAEAAEGGEAAAGSASRREAAPFRAVSRASGQAAPAAVRTAQGVRSAVGTPSRAAQTVTKLIWAVAVGLVVLQVASEATGQYWSFALPKSGAKKPTKAPYAPLYPGQVAAAMPGVFTGSTEGPNVPLSNRSSGNLSLG